MIDFLSWIRFLRRRLLRGMQIGQTHAYEEAGTIGLFLHREPSRTCVNTAPIPPATPRPRHILSTKGWKQVTVREVLEKVAVLLLLLALAVVAIAYLHLRMLPSKHEQGCELYQYMRLR
uniref:Uncharacterized protein n=1 Tax=Anopheles culicifacies TaxID=139723 RepID=A0A182MCM7_9DIPT